MRRRGTMYLRVFGVAAVGLGLASVGTPAGAHEPRELTALHDLAALDAALEAADLPAEVVDALVERAALQRLRGDFGAALADLNEAYELDPEHPQIALQRGLVLAILGYKPNAEDDLAAAERAFEALHSTDRSSARATALLRHLIAATPTTAPARDDEPDAWDDIEDPSQAARQLEDARDALQTARR